ncbi:cysteine desulfurase family protein [Robiginitomaculum antarcticum]|uniref:cysteine desulfurase family protein n=1 Tax=Robiginitomaculum antarcticum TaxID=437507 RepID=UPI00036F7F35|nr:cysteine desulfurase family protein [Robiginitomaculum antarcticum]
MSNDVMTRLYLDHNATTFMRSEAIDATTEAMHVHGNPSAQHADGRAASGLISTAREAVGLAMGVCAQDVIFTGGGTEADNTAVFSAWTAGCRKMLFSAADHPATYRAAEQWGCPHEFIPVDANGVTDVAWLEQRLSKWDEADGRPFVSVAAANSETGVIQPVEAVAGFVGDAGGLLLVDAVQALGKIPMTYIADYISVSAHKIGGPKGVGALYISPDAPAQSLLCGGGQERRRRAGTMNVAGIAGFGAAVKTLDDMTGMNALRDALETGLKAMEPRLTVFGEHVERLPNTSFFAVPDAGSMTLMMQLDLHGISVSTGTACSSGKVGESRTLKAMGVLDKAPKGAIRVSLGHDNTLSDINRFLSAWAKIRHKERKAA